MIIICSILTSCIVSAIVTKVIAAHYFNVMDSYIKDIIEIAKRHMNDVYLSQDRHQ